METFSRCACGCRDPRPQPGGPDFTREGLGRPDPLLDRGVAPLVCQPSPDGAVKQVGLEVQIVHQAATKCTSARAGGIAVRPKAGLPTVIVRGAEPVQITVPKTAAPTKLVVQPLLKGAGPVVARGQSIRINYTGVRWKDGAKFDASGDNGGPLDVQIGEGKVMRGWDKGLVGQTVGSRILLVVSPVDDTVPRALRRSAPRTPWCSSSTFLPLPDSRTVVRSSARHTEKLAQ
jgi:FKBP-type peptidyl-prolyl cis-trans isomerase